MKMKKTSLFSLLLLFTTISTTVFAYEVIPSGEAVGVTVNIEGLLVTETCKVTDENGHTVNAAQQAGIKKGDRITAVNGKFISSNGEMSEYVSSCYDEIVLTVVRKNRTINRVIKPVRTPKGNKLGIWVRDSTAGIGTITFVDPNTNTFAGLGHGISDVDTNDILPISHGNILKCEITEATKGKPGSPGELNGIFKDAVIGKINSNTNSGISGEITEVPQRNTIETGSKDEITEGPATILSDVDGLGVKAYDISIIKINKNDNEGKNMVIEITDKALISKTGGIVQGMSGSPIIQNGKLVGAVTHVFVNDPTRGYGIFIENMLAKTKK